MTARRTSRSSVAIVLLALASGACDTAGTYTAPTAPSSSPSPPLRITAFSVTQSPEGHRHVYGPTLTLTAGADAVAVTELWIELEDRSNGWGAYVRDPRLPYRIPAGETHRLFDGRPAYVSGTDFRAERVWAVVTYVDDSGRSGQVRTWSVAPETGVGR